MNVTVFIRGTFVNIVVPYQNMKLYCIYMYFRFFLCYIYAKCAPFPIVFNNKLYKNTETVHKEKANNVQQL